MAIFWAQVVKRLSPLKESRLPVILISASWAKSPKLAYATPIPAEGCPQPAYEQVVEVRECPVGIRSPQLHEPLFVRAFAHVRPILPALSTHRSTDPVEKQVPRWGQNQLGRRTRR